MTLSYADILQFRDTVRGMTKESLGSMVPGPKYGTVQAGSDWTTGYINVVLNGETTNVAYPVGSLVSDTAGDTVLIDGPNNNRRVVDVITPHSTILNAKSIRAIKGGINLVATEIVGTSGRNINNVFTGGFFLQYATTANALAGSSVMIVDSSLFRIINRDLTVQGGIISTDTMATTTSAANVRWAGGQLYQVTSFTELKTDIEEIDVDYYFLNLKTYTWRDAQEVERHPETTQRYSGTLFEEVRDAGYPIFLSYKENGEPMGVEETKFYSKIIPILRAFHIRLNILEGNKPNDGLAAPTAATTAGQGEVFDGHDPVVSGSDSAEGSSTGEQPRDDQAVAGSSLGD
jgi:hypothetical protein